MNRASYIRILAGPDTAVLCKYTYEYDGVYVSGPDKELLFLSRVQSSLIEPQLQRTQQRTQRMQLQRTRLRPATGALSLSPPSPLYI